MKLPAAFRQAVAGGHGAAGEAWLEQLPRLVAELHERWTLQPAGRFRLSFGYVEPVTRADGTRAVLKLRVPGDPDAAGEGPALAAFGGAGAARLLAEDPELGALLLERLEPGTELAELAAHDDDAATLAAAGVMLRLRRPPPRGHAFPTVAEWGRALAGETLPPAVADRARREHAELCASMDERVLLHGDLHHFNILRRGDGWAAIDPKGVIGEPAYETGALLRNPLPALLDRPDPGRVLARRMDLLAEATGLDRERIHAWARVQAVLAAAWAIEGRDAAGRRFFLRCAELLGVSA